MSLASCVAVDKLCDSGQVVSLASCMSLANCMAVGKLCDGGQVVEWSLSCGGHKFSVILGFAEKLCSRQRSCTRAFTAVESQMASKRLLK
jgi:hypothetical protein